MAVASPEVNFDWWHVGCLYYLCEWSVDLGRPAEAEQYGREALELGHRIGDRMHSVYLVALLARIAAEDGRLECAGLLWGAIEAEEQRATVGQWEDERETYATPVLTHAGPEFERAREKGRSLPFEAAVEEALAGAEAACVPDSSPSSSGSRLHSAGPRRTDEHG